MKLCSNECIPCCDYCIHAEHTCAFMNGKSISISVIACNLHTDEEHQNLAKMCSYCKDFYCKDAED